MTHPIEALSQLNRVTGFRWNQSVGLAWVAKRRQLSLQLLDLPELAREFTERPEVPVAGKPNVRTVDAIPGLRLANGCEAAVHVLYTLTDVAALFANSASAGVIPSSFNRLVKKFVESDQPDGELAKSLGDVQWYRRVREVRTEWSHHSSLFLAFDAQHQPLVVVQALRRSSDRVVIPSKTQFTVTELCNWIGQAAITTDRFANYVLRKFIVPSMVEKQHVVVTDLAYGPDGTPEVDELGGFRIQKYSIGDLLRRVGYEVPEKQSGASSER